MAKLFAHIFTSEISGSTSELELLQAELQVRQRRRLGVRIRPVRAKQLLQSTRKSFRKRVMEALLQHSNRWIARALLLVRASSSEHAAPCILRAGQPCPHMFQAHQGEQAGLPRPRKVFAEVMVKFVAATYDLQLSLDTTFHNIRLPMCWLRSLGFSTPAVTTFALRKGAAILRIGRAHNGEVRR